jgi:hypothetical protein
MASHFKWYPSSGEVVVPFNARFSFPSQANKAVKMTPRIPPKNAETFNPGGIIRCEFPAQGYVNPGNTTLEFDVQLKYTPLLGDFSQVRFQNNIQSIFSRVRLLYGSTPLEDIVGYNVLVRSLTEWTGTTQQGSLDQTSINEGIGGITAGVTAINDTDNSTNITEARGSVHVRKNLIHGIDMTRAYNVPAGETYTQLGNGGGAVPNGPDALSIATHDLLLGANPIRRYQVQLALGLFNQEKLIPTKFMASQLAIEITLAPAAECIIYNKVRDISTVVTVNPPTYEVTHVNLIPEILEFDASYDESFIRGLMENGVPIKFATWNNYRFNTGAGTNVNLQIQERSRSVKAIFCLQRRDPQTIDSDSGATFFNSNITSNIGTGSSTFNEYQFRIGGRYFPAAPVQCSTEVGGRFSNGGAEAWVELSKALNTLGDYRLSCPCNTLRWACNPGAEVVGYSSISPTATAALLPEHDFEYSVAQYGAGGMPIMRKVMEAGSGVTIGSVTGSISANAFAGNMGSGCFAMAIDLETSQGTEISGLNAEEQSDISLIARFSAAQQIGFIFDVYTYVDTMIVLKENNVIELIQ